MKYIIIVLLCTILLTGCTFQSGFSQDYIQGYDTGILWNHLYLLNDHNTCYCFDDENFRYILEQAKEEHKKIEVTYEKYLIRGTLCFAGERYETVVITNVEIIEDKE